MKAIVQERFGPPDVLQLVDTDLPEAGAGEVLVRLRAAALNPTVTAATCSSGRRLVLLGEEHVGVVTSVVEQKSSPRHGCHPGRSTGVGFRAMAF